MLSANEIRQQFIDFFVKKHGHTFVPSSPVVPHDDPTLLFTNAGMNQFKPYFLGTERAPYKRAANTQKCIRAGGKHNDLDDVGKDTYHHTFFEMLGNWSFGDYFKKEAIRWAWELLTEVWKLDKTRLHVTVFEGDESQGLARDDEAAAFWRSETDIDPSHIHLGNKKDNFWEMGDTGPCGPCTEIHIDRTPDKTGGKLVNAGTPDVIEIWNLVFIQFNSHYPDPVGLETLHRWDATPEADRGKLPFRARDEIVAKYRKLAPLPAKHVDTGMGFERVTAVLQGKGSNYDTDVFTPIFAAIQKVTGAPAYTGKLDDLKDTAYRVIGDHIRTLTFALTDGAAPGKEGRDYVLRRILRRAERYGRQVFGTTKPFLCDLVPTVVETMGHFFPELKQNPGCVADLIRDDEVSFIRTLDRGIKLFQEAVVRTISEKMKQEKGYLKVALYEDPRRAEYILDFIDSAGVGTTVPLPMNPEGMRRCIHAWFPEPPVLGGTYAFKLHDTYGLYIDITEQMAEEVGLKVDRAGFEKEMKDAKDKARGARKKFVVTAVKGELPKTDDSLKYVGLRATANVLGWVKDNVVVTEGQLRPNEEAALLLDRTPFYAEQGGQVGDLGSITTETGQFDVEDTQKLGDAILHLGRVSEGHVEVGQSGTLEVSGERPHTMRNHTSTHLLNWALRQVLGEHIDQKGSYVDAEKTRFDFAHDKPLSAEEIAEVERLVNEKIYADLPVTPVVMSLAEAKTIPGVRAVFGEKYPDPVRVLVIGADADSFSRERSASADLSVEFCGGTHLNHTGQAGFFKIVSQELVGKGVRRVTAVTGREAVATVQRLSSVLDDLAGRFNCKPEEVPARVESLQEELKKLQNQMRKGAAGDATSAADKLFAEAKEIGGIKVIVGEMPAVPVDAMRTQVDRLRQKAKSCAILLGWVDDGKVGLLAALTDDALKKGLEAGKLVGEVAKVVGGKGGGRKEMAQAGGTDPAKLPEALALAQKLVSEKLGGTD